jgi:RNA polymerase sigma factor (TIGR02999 family)
VPETDPTAPGGGAPPAAGPDPSPDLTDLLRAAQAGDVSAQDAAARLVYGTLHDLAATCLRGERGDHTLQPTALVHEAYLRLLGQDAPWRNRSQFFGIAAQMMRRILVDHARRATADRRDRARQVPLDAVGASVGAAADDPVAMAVQDVLGVHEALAQLERVDERQARVVELKFFVGLSIDEIGEVLGISHATVSREWAMARAWLRQRLDTR